MNENKFDRIDDKPFPNRTYKGILLPILQMADPYYPHSHLGSSIVSGYYILFFMYCCYFIIVYPFLNYLHGEALLSMTIIKLVQTNLLWDLISVLLFIFLALVLMQVTNTQILPNWLVGVIVVIMFVGSSYMITSTYPMYFTDRIFINVLSWAFCVKTVSYMLDKNNPQSQQLLKQEQQKHMGTIMMKVKYLISPTTLYHRFIVLHDPKLTIHFGYLVRKCLVSFLCLMVNNILVVTFIEPACQSDLSFVALLFKLIPLTFYINMTLYYMVMDNILASLAEMTQMKERIYYLDWWNAETIYQFLDRWCLLVSQFTDQYFFRPKSTQHPPFRYCLHVGMLICMLLSVFGQSFNFMAFSVFAFIEMSVLLCGGISCIQNNYIVHILTIGFTPFLLALQVKYDIFN